MDRCLEAHLANSNTGGFVLVMLVFIVIHVSLLLKLNLLLPLSKNESKNKENFVRFAGPAALYLCVIITNFCLQG